MKPFSELSYRGQIGRLRALGERALKRFGVRPTSMRHIAHAENCTFEVRAATSGRGRASAPYVSGRYLLRIHRPGYQTRSSVASELDWLATLREDLDLHVPEPMVARDGSPVVVLGSEGVPEERVCSLLRWMGGKSHGRKGERLLHLRLVGRLMGKLHSHAVSWKPPTDFHRGRWDWDGLFESPGTAGMDESWIWETLPTQERRLYEESARNTADAMEQLGEGGDAFGLIHADLHLGNVLFGGGEARAIDFDDCGGGHWIYDMAVVLHDHRRKDDWPEWRDALLDGYAEERELPDGVEPYLETFMCARCVSLMLWAHARARENPRSRKQLASWVDWSVEYLKDYCTE